MERLKGSCRGQKQPFRFILLEFFACISECYEVIRVVLCTAVYCLFDFNALTLCYLDGIEQEHVLTITSQQQDLDSKSHAISQSLKDRAAIESKAEAMGGTLRALETEILNLRGERTAMQEQLRSDGDSAKVLDEYKKRAQLALKKVREADVVARVLRYLLSAYSTVLCILLFIFILIVPACLTFSIVLISCCLIMILSLAV